MRIPAVLLVLLSAMVVRADAPDREPHPARRPADAIRAAGYHYSPVAASNGSDFFAAWIDSRGGGQELYGTVVRRDGTVVSPLGINVAFPDTSVRNPAVVWDGEAWVVVWIADYRLRLIRIDRDGNRLEPEPRTLFANILDTRPVALASNGNGSLVAVQGRDIGPYLLELAALDRRGNVVGETRIPSDDAGALTIAATRSGYAIFAATHGKEIQVRQADERAALEDEAAVVLARDLHAWTLHSASLRDRVLLTYTCYGGRVVQGRLGDGRTFGAPFPVANGDDWEHGLIADSDGFLVGFEREVARVNVPMTGDVGIPPQPVFDIHTVRVTLDGRVSDELPLVRQPFSEREVALAAGGGIFTAFIEYQPGGALHKVAAALSASRAQTAEAIDLALSDRVQSAPAVAAGRDGYLLVWEEQPRNDDTRTIMARFPGRTPFAVSGGDEDQLFPSVAFDGERYLVIWVAIRSRSARMVGRFVSRSGVIEGPQLEITDEDVDAWTRPALASSGDGFVLVWASRRSIPPGANQQIYVARIARGGAVLGTTPITLGQSLPAHELVLAGGAGLYALGWWAWGGMESALLRGEAVLGRFTSGGRNWESPALGCYDGGCVIASHGGTGWLTVAPIGGGEPRAIWLASSDPRVAAAGRWLLVLFKSLDSIGVWLPDEDTVAHVAQSRLTQRFAAAVSEAGSAVVAWEAPSPRHGGVRRIHVMTFDAARIGR